MRRPNRRVLGDQTTGGAAPEILCTDVDDDDDFYDNAKSKPYRSFSWSQRRDFRILAGGIVVALQLFWLFRQWSPLLQQMMTTNENKQKIYAYYKTLRKDFSVTFPFTNGNQTVSFNEPPSLNEEVRERGKVGNYADLDFRLFEYDGERRVIFHDDHEDWDHETLKHWDAVTGDEEHEEDEYDNYYAFDDDELRNPMVDYPDPALREKRCRRTSWHRDLRIDCNKLHEFDVQKGFRRGDTSYLASGSYREAYLSEPSDGGEDVIFKAYYWGSEFAMNDFEYMRMDAIVTDLFTASPLIVNLYGFCGTGMIAQPVMHGRMDEVAMPHDDMEERIEEISNDGDLVVVNDLSGNEKLHYSLQMAQAVALLHTYDGGVIVHDDIALEQFLVDENDNVVLQDFNRAEIMLWNEKDEEYCRYHNGAGRGFWRSPEEYADAPLNEKIDVWSLCNNFYTLLTGHPAFFHLEDLEELNATLSNGDIAFIDPRFHERSFEEGILADLIPRGWKLVPDDRIDITEMVSVLEEAYEESNRRIEDDDDSE